MMTEAQALSALAREDPEAADEAKAALSWLTNGAGLETVSQLKLQEFVWYALPVKWPMTTGELIAVTRALGRLFSMLGMERYAEVCMCPATEKILTAYGDGHETGIAAYAEAVENSSTAPSDTGLLAWGSVMGPDERAAYDACAAAVELAIASGELPAGSRGWRAKRTALIDRWLTAPPPARDGQTGWNDPARGHPAGGHPAPEGRSQPGRHRAGAHHAPGVSGTWLARIHTERMDAWANSRPGERSRLAAAVLPRLLEEAGAPDGALPTLGWLLGHADAGPAADRPALHPARAGHRGRGHVRLAGAAGRRAETGTRRVPAAHPARAGPGRDGRDPAQRHQPAADPDGTADDRGPRRPGGGSAPPP